VVDDLRSDRRSVDVVASLRHNRPVGYLSLDFRLDMLCPLGFDEVRHRIEIADWKAMVVYQDVMTG
jgi:hypothetical protein